jgi:phenylalanyl-tRNA synthetase beta chain
LGIVVPVKDVIAILKRLSIKTLAKAEKSLTLEIPTFRQDIVLPENLIEEVGRVYGYDKIKPVFPYRNFEPVRRNDDVFWQNRTKDILKKLGYAEVYNYSFVSAKDVADFDLDARKVKNPVSEDFEYLRTSLLPQLLKNTKENLKTYKNFKIFEINRVFLKQKNKTLENRYLSAVAVAGSNSFQELFLRCRGEINLMLEKLGIMKIRYEKGAEGKIWHSPNAMSIIVNDKKLGTFGQISFDILDKMGINEKVFALDLDFEKLQSFCSEEKRFETISFHPSATRDISGLVAKDVNIEEVIEKIKQTEKLIRAAEAFDVYQGKGVPEGYKSVSFHIVFQSEEKTLDTKTIDNMQKQILNNLINSFNWEERK